MVSRVMRAFSAAEASSVSLVPLPRRLLLPPPVVCVGGGLRPFLLLLFIVSNERFGYKGVHVVCFCSFSFCFCGGILNLFQQSVLGCCIRI